MDEHRFVDRLIEQFPFKDGVGIGDDAAVIPRGDGYQLVTTDMLVENVHFRMQDTGLEALARKALGVNVSDIAAMGGEPLHAFLDLGFPKELGQKSLDEFLQGIRQGCDRWKIQLGGGDFSRCERLFIAITLCGFASRPIYRNGAKPGDFIAITGPTGRSALGLRCLLDNHHCPDMIAIHQTCDPHVNQGRILSAYASAMIDVSDGLLIDLERILRASHVGATIQYENLPVSRNFQEYCHSFGYDEQQLVLSGGEDYVLLFSITGENEQALRKKESIEYWIIGTVEDHSGDISVTKEGNPLKLQSSGYDHFNP